MKIIPVDMVVTKERVDAARKLMGFDDVALHRMRNRVYRAAEEALTHLDSAKLTEEQRFSLAFLAGVPLALADATKDTKDGLLIKHTLQPCAVDIVNGRVYVFWKDTYAEYDPKSQPSGWNIFGMGERTVAIMRDDMLINRPLNLNQPELK